MDPGPPLKFPPLRPPPGAAARVRGLPTPAGYRHGMPLIGATDPAVPAPLSERRRRWLWFGVAVGLHAALLLGIWLMPPLRLKWNPPPEDWVPVVSLPKPVEPPAPAPVSLPVPATTMPAPKKAAAPKSKLKGGAAATIPAQP